MQNIGYNDRAIRVLTTIVVLLLILTNVITGTAAVFTVLIFSWIILHGIVGYCPLYDLLNISTCKVKA